MIEFDPRMSCDFECVRNTGDPGAPPTSSKLTRPHAIARVTRVRTRANVATRTGLHMVAGVGVEIRGPICDRSGVPRDLTSNPLLALALTCVIALVGCGPKPAPKRAFAPADRDAVKALLEMQVAA